MTELQQLVEKLKDKVDTIEGLESLKLFSKLTIEEERKLIKTQRKLFKLIKTL